MSVGSISVNSRQVIFTYLHYLGINDPAVIDKYTGALKKILSRI